MIILSFFFMQITSFQNPSNTYAFLLVPVLMNQRNFIFPFKKVIAINTFKEPFSCTAERGGFEPPIPFCGIHAFQACQFSHSCTSPFSGMPQLEGCKIIKKYEKEIKLSTYFPAQVLIEIHFNFVVRKPLPQ